MVLKQFCSQSVSDSKFGQFIREVIFDEIIPVVKRELPDVENDTISFFAKSILERFQNPYLEHRILDLTLNGLSKFKIRLLPVIEEHAKIHRDVPRKLSLAFAAFLLFYRNDDNKEKQWEIRDDSDMIALIQKEWASEQDVGLANAVSSILRLKEVWGEDLNQICGLSQEVTRQIQYLRDCGAESAVLRTVQKG